MIKKLLCALLALAIMGPTVAMNNTNKEELEKKLYGAVLLNNSKEVKKYISEGAPLTYVRSIINTNVTNASLLFIALWYRAPSIEIVKSLINNGVSIDKPGIYTDTNSCHLEERGPTPLILAAQRNDVEICKLLLDKGADVHAQTYTKENALFWAEKNENHQLIALLKKHGAELPKNKHSCPNACSIQ